MNSLTSLYLKIILFIKIFNSTSGAGDEIRKESKDCPLQKLYKLDHLLKILEKDLYTAYYFQKRLNKGEEDVDSYENQNIHCILKERFQIQAEKSKIAKSLVFFEKKI